MEVNIKQQQSIADLVHKIRLPAEVPQKRLLFKTNTHMPYCLTSPNISILSLNKTLQSSAMSSRATADAVRPGEDGDAPLKRLVGRVLCAEKRQTPAVKVNWWWK